MPRPPAMWAGAHLVYDGEMGPYSPVYVSANPEIFQTLVDAGAKFPKTGHTPMHVAQTPAMVDYFVKLGLSVNGSSADRTTPLHQAASQGRAEVVRRLLELGADPNISNQFGKPPIQSAKNSAVRRVFQEFAAQAAK